VRIEKGKCHCHFEWCVCIWFVNFEFCQRVITGQQAFNLSCHMKGQTCHCQSQSQVLVLPFYYLFINWLINETVRFSCDFSKTAMDDIYIYIYIYIQLFKTKRILMERTLKQIILVSRDTIVIIQFFPRDGAVCLRL